ncbi:hypothetical protein S2091_2178 [Solimicrobium silvestre]|uniref:Uncharacterized protein n=2 Tax=Solimicrobium silvestre TaxID=2099400 RepID=A0A2S9GZD0_9BURK|nr:hypothetical protein S2091_2178 [Solimicrobium silvestre]
MNRLIAALLIFLIFCDISSAAVTVKSFTADIQKEKNEINLSDELNSFFKNSGCSLPKALIKKLDKQDKAYIPGELKNLMSGNMTSEVDKYSGKGVLAVLNTAWFVNAQSVSIQVTLTGAETYINYDPLGNMDMQADNFAYAMDCSGFLNSSISSAGGISGSDAAMAAKSALEIKKSMLAVKASVFSPIALAISPDIGGNLSRRQRISVLYSLSREINGLYVDAPDTTKVSSGRMIPAIWTSSAGASSLQGEASLSSNLGASVGVFSASANVAGNATFSKSISFSKFDTYIINSQEIPTIGSDLKAINDTTVQLVNSTTIANPVRRIDSSYQALFDLPSQICKKIWTIKSFKSQDVVVPGTVQTTWDGLKGCEVTINPISALGNDEIGLVLETSSDLKPDLKFVLKVPIR